MNYIPSPKRSPKETIEEIIKQKGNCSRIACWCCPINSDRSEKNCVRRSVTYKLAIEYYVNTYGQDDLVELLV